MGSFWQKRQSCREFLSTAEFIGEALTKTESVVLPVLANHLDQGQTKVHNINFRVSKPI